MLDNYDSVVIISKFINNGYQFINISHMQTGRRFVQHINISMPVQFGGDLYSLGFTAG